MAADDLQHQNQKQLENGGKELMTDDSNQRYDQKYLTEVIFLAHNLNGLKQDVNNLKGQITDRPAIDGDPGHTQGPWQMALTAAKQQEQLEKKQP